MRDIPGSDTYVLTYSWCDYLMFLPFKPVIIFLSIRPFNHASIYYSSETVEVNVDG